MFDTIENQIKRAEHAINDLSKTPNECEWFQILLDLLKDNLKEKQIEFSYDDNVCVYFADNCNAFSRRAGMCYRV